MGKQRAHRRAQNARLPDSPIVARAPLPSLVRRPMPAREHRSNATEPKLVCTPRRYVGQIIGFRHTAFILLCDRNGTTAFVSGHLLDRPLWKRVVRGGTITCIAQSQEGRDGLYVTRVFEVERPTMALPHRQAAR